MAGEPDGEGNAGGDAARADVLHRTASVRIIVIVFAAVAVVAAGALASYFLIHGNPRPVIAGSTAPVTPSVPASTVSRPASSASPGSSRPSVPAATTIPIPMSAACRWAYPSQSDGKFSGSGYSIVCLGANKEILGGFSGSHSLNAWCAEAQHTDGRDLPSPALDNGEWLCTA